MITSRGPLIPSGPGRADLRRLPPSDAVADLVRHFWIARWEVPDGAVHEQRVLTYPACNVVVESDAGRFYGPVTALSRKRLTGAAAAFGVLLQPAAGALLSDVPLPELADSHRESGDFGFDVGASIAAALDAGSADDAVADFERWLTRRLPDGADEAGLLINRITDAVEQDTSISRVRDLAGRFALTDRSLQRLVRERVGMHPKWLIQRRRLQDAAHRMATGAAPNLARLAHALEYADQAHFTRDFSAVVGLTPSQYIRQLAAGPERP